MAGQAIWGPYGDPTNAELVSRKRQKEIYIKSPYNTIVGGLNGGRNVDVQIQRFANGKVNKTLIGNSSVIWETRISEGNEAIYTMLEHRDGLPGGYGDYPSVVGDYDKYKHVVVWNNQIDSKAVPLPGRCSQKQVKDILTDVKGDAISGMQLWAGQQIDWNFIAACLMGASPELLLTTQGGLGKALPGCSAGQIKSCWNTYVVGTGLVTQSTTRATYEAAIGTAVTALSDNATNAFDLGQHNLLVDLIGSLFFKKPTTPGGKMLNAIVLSDPWLLARFAASSGDFVTLKQYAFQGAGADTPLYDQMQPILKDSVLYIPCEQLKKYRASVSGGVPVYGPGITSDPRTYSNTQKVCGQIWLGAGALLRATDRAMWITSNLVDAHKGNWTYALHWDDGFVRRDWYAKDGRTEFDCDSIMVAWFYDPGPEVAFAA